MRRRIIVLFGLLALGAALAVPALGAGGATTDADELVATLTGGGEVPPVQTATAGIAHVTIDVDKRLLCYDFSITGKEPVAAHIHKGADGVNGDVVVNFADFGQRIKRSSEGCTRRLPRSLLRAIADNPAGYYVNIHTPANPGGEVRGQLAS